MAKKKEKELTLEERLEQALVPVEEQPYEVPENWCWTYISSGFQVTSSKRIHKEDWVNEGIPFYRTRELVKLSNNGYVDNELFITSQLYEELKSSFGVPNANDILISGVGTIGVPFVITTDDKFYFKDGNVIWFKNKGLCSGAYVFYLYKSDFMYNQIHEMSAGTTVDTYTIINANHTMIPLPPLKEQYRIVEIIERLFAKLDEAKEKVQIVINASENRKAAILHAAFSGVLTEKWRELHLVAESTWRELGFTEVADIKSNLVSPEDYLEYPHIAPDNIEKKTGRLLDYRTIAEDRVTSSKHKFYPGQILYSKIRPYLSKVVMVDFDGLCSADMYPIEAKENMEYLWFYMLSDMFLEQVTTAGSRSVLPKINQKELSKIKVKIPSENEQEKIVKILKKVFERENIIKDLVETVLESIELTKKSILSRAFHGELGTNDISEPCSIELLKEIIN